MSELLGKKVQLRITEINRSRRRVVGSIRAVQYEMRKSSAEKTWSEIEVGKKYQGVVKSLTSYGAFVDIGGVDGMVHVSELSWNRIRQPGEVVKVGDEIDVYVISFDREKKRISLGYRTAENNPWTLFTNAYQVGDTAMVKIVKLMPSGLRPAYPRRRRAYTRFPDNERAPHRQARRGAQGRPGGRR
jgi:4-hydroxy-3-methylbut-2-enyl diphosphate reductase